MSELQKQLSSVKGGRVSLAEAIRQLDVAKEAFSLMDSIDQRLESQESLIKQLKNENSKLIQMSYFQTKYKELSSRIDSKIKHAIDEFSKRWQPTLREKVDISDLHDHLDSKANWTAIHDLNKDVSIVKCLLNQHLNTEFPNFKTQMKLKLKANNIHDRNEVDLQIENVGNLKLTSMKQIYLNEEEKDIDKFEEEKSLRKAKEMAIKEERALRDKQISESYNTVQEVSVQNSKDIQMLQQAIDQLNIKTKGMIQSIDRFENPSNQSSPRKHIPLNPEFKINEKHNLKRNLEEKDKKITGIEKKLNKIIEDTNTINANTKDFVAESLHNVQKVSQIKHDLMSEISKCMALIRYLEDSTNSKIKALKKTIEEFRGPFRDLVQNQQKQLDALTEDIRRHQDISRSIVQEYTNTKHQFAPEQGITSRKTITTREQQRSRSITPSDQPFKPANSFFSREKLKLPRYSIRHKNKDI